MHPPALLVVGAVVALREDLAWYEQLPLFGQRIVVTRPAEEASRAAAGLEALGAEVAAGADGRGPADHRPGAARRRDRAAWPIMTGSSSRRPTASGSSSSGWSNEAVTCGPWAI